jgi:hypothetical protein
VQLIRERLPKRDEIMAVFSISLILIHFRSYLITFYAIPAYLKRMSFWDTLGIVAYVQIVALMEAFLFLVMTLFVNITLPKSLFREKFKSQGVIFVTLTFAWIIPIHYQSKIIAALYGNYSKYYLLVGSWAILYFGVLVFLSILLRKSSKFKELVEATTERVSPLVIIYLGLDLFYVGIIIIRNML